MTERAAAWSALPPVAALLPDWLHWDPWVVVPLGLALLLYLRGCFALWYRAGMGHGVSGTRTLAFALGGLVVAAALLTPLHDWAQQRFAAHVVQHALLTVLAAPLLVLARPLGVFAWALPANPRRTVAPLLRQPQTRRAWRWLSSAPTAGLLHAAALWLWHLPAPFDAALADPRLHAAQHASLLATALLFWWAVLGPRWRRGRLQALVLLLATVVSTGALGALLALAAEPLYAGYSPHMQLPGRDPVLVQLLDQQLGGLLLWVPANAAYALAALWLGARLLGRPFTLRAP